MKKIINFLFVLVICFSISACGNSVSFLSITPTPLATYTPIPSVTSSLSITSGTPEIPVLVKTSLEFHRNGKIYEIIIGYGIGDAFFYATPRAEIPANLISDIGVTNAEIKRYGDFDNDSEREFIVSILSCGASCLETIRLYDYDAAKDEYYVGNDFNASINDYTDINNDGSLELITTGFCVVGDACSGGYASYSALKVLRYENGEFVDVTSEFPEMIQTDAEKFLELARENKDDAVYDTLPVYLFDMYRLGKIDEALSVFEKICAEIVKQPLKPYHNYSQNCAEMRTWSLKRIGEYFKETGIKP